VSFLFLSGLHYDAEQSMITLTEYPHDVPVSGTYIGFSLSDPITGQCWLFLASMLEVNVGCCDFPVDSSW
jgi:hypothetical protein